MTGPHTVYARHACPGAPIEVCWINGHIIIVTDLEAQRLVADLSKAILANAQERARVKESPPTFL